MENKEVTVEFLGSQITFANLDEMREQVQCAMKQFSKFSSEYAQLRMIQLRYGL